MASGSGDKTIKFWNIEKKTLKKTLTGHKNSIWSLVVLKNGDLISGSLDTTIKIWDVESGMVKTTLKGFRVINYNFDCTLSYTLAIIS